MVLSDSQIKERLITPENTDIKQFKKDHKLLDMFYNGGDAIATHLDKIQNFENDDQLDLRKKIARSTKDTLEKILNPFKKVFTASGGSEYYKLSSDSQSEDFKELVSDLPEGISLRKWMEVYWQEGYITDPNGVILIESEAKEEDPKSYPTYKSISVIHDYKMTWKRFEYIIFSKGKQLIGKQKFEVFRVIDDTKDGLYYIENDVLKQVPDYNEDGEEISTLITHNKGFVPAVLISDIVDKKTSGKKSFIFKITELIDEFLRDSSVLSIYKFFHLYPKYWQYVTKCTRCRGTGEVTDKEGNKGTCPSCNGERYNLKKDVSDGVRLPLPQHKDDPTIAPNIAGFVEPPIDAWDKMVEELERLQKEMEFVIWGSYSEADKSETATGRFIDAQPVIDNLRSVSDSAENVEYYIAYYMARWMHSLSEDQVDITIKYGKRFLVEQPDELWEKYITAKKDKAPISTLDQHYKEYLLARYHNDLEMYDQKLKEFYLEPFVHYTLPELKDFITPEDMRRKLYFGEWVSDDTMIDFNKDIEVLRQEFEQFLTDKPLRNEENSGVQSNSQQAEGSGRITA